MSMRWITYQSKKYGVDVYFFVYISCN